MALTRRQLLVAGGATLALGGGAGFVLTRPGQHEQLTLYSAFNTEVTVGDDLRLPFALAGSEQSLDLADPPTRIDVALRSPGGVTSTIGRVDRHARGIPRGYYPVRTTLAEEGEWTVLVTAAGQHLSSTLTARAKGVLPVVPGPGDTLPRIPTPTPSAALGVDPICTRKPACPFHSVSLEDAPGRGGPIVLIVSTPAYCQVAICGPVLDLVIDRRKMLDAAGVSVIHAEVYTDDTARTTTATVNALGLTYEPALFLAAPDGTVGERLDYTFDADELDAALRRLVA